MNRLTALTALAALATLCGTQLHADITVINSTDTNADIYLVPQSWASISKNNKAGNAAYDFDGGLDDPKGPFRTLKPKESTDYIWESSDPRSGIPLEKIMVKFAGQLDFQKAVASNKMAAGTNQTITLTVAGGRPRISYEGGDSLTATTTAGTEEKSVTAGLMKPKAQSTTPITTIITAPSTTTK